MHNFIIELFILSISYLLRMRWGPHSNMVTGCSRKNSRSNAKKLNRHRFPKIVFIVTFHHVLLLLQTKFYRYHYNEKHKIVSITNHEMLTSDINCLVFLSSVRILAVVLTRYVSHADRSLVLISFSTNVQDNEHVLGHHHDSFPMDRFQYTVLE